MCYCLEGPYNYLELTQVRYPVQAKVGLLKRRGIKQCKSFYEIQEDKISKYIVLISLSKLDRQLSVDFLICFPFYSHQNYSKQPLTPLLNPFLENKIYIS